MCGVVSTDGRWQWHVAVSRTSNKDKKPALAWAKGLDLALSLADLVR